MSVRSLHNGAWVNRIPKTQVIPNPGNGVDFTITAPLTEQWELTGLIATLTTSAVAGARVAKLEVFDGTNSIGRFVPGQSIAASSVGLFALQCGGPIGVGTAPANGGWGVPEGLWVPAGNILRVITSALDAGDAWTNIVLGYIAEVFR